MSAAASHWQPSEAHRRCRREVALAFGVTEVELISATRTRPLVTPRHAAMFILRERFGLSWRCIAITLGCSDHTSAMHGYRSARSKMDESPAYKATIKALLASKEPRHCDAHVIAWSVHRTSGWQRSKTRLSLSRAHATADVLVLSRYRKVKPKNELADDDFDAVKRAHGSSGLSNAIAAAGGWPKPKRRIGAGE